MLEITYYDGNSSHTVSYDSVDAFMTAYKADNFAMANDAKITEVKLDGISMPLNDGKTVLDLYNYYVES